MNRNRTFIVVEQVYFSRWYDRDATPRERQLFRQFLRNGQLEFVAGGWVMHDEASVTAHQMVEQMACGQRYLHQRFGHLVRDGGGDNDDHDDDDDDDHHGRHSVDSGVSAVSVDSVATPRYGFQIDPFGHSAVTPMVFARMGFHAVVLNRIHWADRDRLSQQRAMEFLWRSGASSGWSGDNDTMTATTTTDATPKADTETITTATETTDILAHVLDQHYSFPRGGLDFEGPSGNPPIAGDDDLRRRCRVLATDLHHRKRAYPSSRHFLQLLGDDFKWLNATVQVSLHVHVVSVSSMVY